MPYTAAEGVGLVEKERKEVTSKVDNIAPSSSSSTPFNMNVQMDPNIGSRMDSCTVARSMMAWHTAFLTLAEVSEERADRARRKAFIFATSAWVPLPVIIDVVLWLEKAVWGMYCCFECS